MIYVYETVYKLIVTIYGYRTINWVHCKPVT